MLRIILAFIAAATGFAGTAQGADGRDRDFVFQSEALQEDRAISVSLPKYYGHSDKYYPVLYVLDGEWAFEYAKGAVGFLTSDIVGLAPDLIIVGIPNTVRQRDLSVTRDENDQSDAFIDFLENELKPAIDARYRTNGFDLLYGWSSASGINLEIVFTKSDLFDAHILTGTGVGPRTYAYGEGHLPENTYRQVRLYAATEEGPPRAPALRRLDDLLTAHAPEGLQWKTEIMEGETHLDVLSKGLYAGLEYVFSSFEPPTSAIAGGAESVKAYFSGLSDEYGFSIEMPVGAITEAASLLYQDEQLKEAISLVEYGVDIHPYAADLHGTLAELKKFDGDNAAALEHYNHAAQIAADQGDVATRLRYEALAASL